jgi:hypothetical protein
MEQLPPYDIYLRQPLDEFWSEYGVRGRKVLFVFGVGFDPRCIPALKVIAEIFGHGAQLDTFCTRFTNLLDRQLSDNSRYTAECLQNIHAILRTLSGKRFRHYEVEVNMFSDRGSLIGDQILLKEFEDCLRGRLEEYTDVIVDISAFPRTLVFALLRLLWRIRPAKNLFAVLTETPDVQVKIDEDDHGRPTMLGGAKLNRDSRILWIPVLGAAVRRFKKIKGFLKPMDIVPIIPFPARNPRVGDDILLAGQNLFRDWDIPFRNVMYASADNPFDVFRKIQDIVYKYRKVFGPQFSIVVSALSGRSLSLGVLLAALHSDLVMCHAQPKSYFIQSSVREQLKLTCANIMPTLYWLNGELYSYEP